MKRILAVLLFAVTVSAQSANVIELSPADQSRAQKAWDALMQAKADWAAFQDEIGQRYTQVKPGDPDGSTNVPQSILYNLGGSNIACLDSTDSCFSAEEKSQRKAARDTQEAQRRLWRSGFESGFEFSKDFRFIVPKVPEVKPNYSPYIINGVTDCSHVIGGCTYAH